MTRLDLVGYSEIAERLGVSRRTVETWRQREILPEPEWIVSGSPIWRGATITRWTEKTGYPKAQFNARGDVAT